ncbi:hypothetical protein V9T40_006698 [Parthenolecanium corni]|uniref:Uncharacterized protein n=1 Tax=Parthenolecanium corni TaxID=536013 RepID=A0AAN9TP65_9HEMI
MAQGGESNQNQVKDPASLLCSAMDSIVTTVHFYDNLRSFKGILPVTVVKELEYYYNTVYGPRGVKRYRNRRVPPQLTVFNDTIVWYPVKYDEVRYIEEYIPPDKPETVVVLHHKYCRYCWQQHVSKFIPKSDDDDDSDNDSDNDIYNDIRVNYGRLDAMYDGAELQDESVINELVCDRCLLPVISMKNEVSNIKHSKMFTDTNMPGALKTTDVKYLEIIYTDIIDDTPMSYFIPCDNTVTSELVASLRTYMYGMRFHCVGSFDISKERIDQAISVNDMIGYERFTLIDRVLTAKILRRFIRYNHPENVTFDSIGGCIDFTKFQKIGDSFDEEEDAEDLLISFWEMNEPNTLFESAASIVVNSVYSYVLLEKLKGILPATVLEEVETSYFNHKDILRSLRNNKMRENRPEWHKKISETKVYGIIFTGIYCEETHPLDLVHIARHQYCYGCWGPIRKYYENYEANEARGVSVHIVYMAKNSVPRRVLGSKIHWWPLDFTCLKCEKCLFRIEWSEEEDEESDLDSSTSTLNSSGED